MRTIRVESTVVTIHGFLAYTAYVFELDLITAKMCYIHDEVVLGFIYKFCHTETVPYGFLKCCLNQILRNAPLPPIEINGGSGSWNQTYVVAVI
jgi:hypothetical protein